MYHRSPPVSSSNIADTVFDNYDVDKENVKKARVLYDYDAEDDSQLSLLIDQVLFILAVCIIIHIISIGYHSVSFE